MSRLRGGSRVTTRSLIRISPLVTGSNPATIRSAVVLPQPDGPTSTRNSPGSTSRLSSLTATTPPGKCLVTASRLMVPVTTSPPACR